MVRGNSWVLILFEDSHIQIVKFYANAGKTRELKHDAARRRFCTRSVEVDGVSGRDRTLLTCVSFQGFWSFSVGISEFSGPFYTRIALKVAMCGLTEYAELAE